jgi:DNA polymerase-3 subunit beta
MRICRDELNDALGFVASAADARGAKPALACVRLRAAGGLELFATDLDVEAVAVLDADDAGELDAAVDAARLARIVSAARGEEVELSLCADELVVASGGASWRLPTFPEAMSPAPMGPHRSAAVEDLRGALAVVLPAVAREPGQYAIGGVYVELGGGRLTLAATDTHRLHCLDLPASAESDGSASAIVPAAAARMARRLGGGGGTVLVGESSVRFCGRNRHLTARAIEGHFPRFRSVVPDESPARLDVHPSALGDAVDAAGIVADPQIRRVALVSDGETLEIEAGSGSGGRARVPVEGAEVSAPFEAGFDAAYLSAACRACVDAGSAPVSVGLGGEAPICIRDGDLTVVVSPMFAPGKAGKGEAQ